VRFPRDATGVTLVRDQNATGDYILVKSSSESDLPGGCIASDGTRLNCANVGYGVGGIRKIWIANAIWQIAAHEFGHSLGMKHEQQRDDRASYVEETSGKTMADCLGSRDTGTLRSAYNYRSIMHYVLSDFPSGCSLNWFYGTPHSSWGNHTGLKQSDIDDLAAVYR
jgi:hypothetical protein